MLPNRLFRVIAALAAVVIVTVFSCSQEETVIDRTLSVSIPLKTVETKASSQFVTVEAAGAWELSIDFGEAEENWASVEPASGEGRRSDIVLSWERNTGEDARSCTLTVTSGDGHSSATFVQNGTSGSGGGSSEIEPDIPGGWLELPATDDPDLYFITHDMERGGKTVRNYSYYYSPDDRIAVWVAYPLNKGLIGGSFGRTDEWVADPKIPTRYQQIIERGYKGGYERGHQIPSADRQQSDDNAQTFYFTNSTPQLGSLNGAAWSSLEGMIRDWSRQVDTLYVVTGADIQSSTKVAYDNNGNPVTVPVGYFKALLARGIEGQSANQTGGWAGIAFYFEHRSYSNDKSTIMEQSMTIDKLERMTGYDFFVNLPARVGESVAAQVESEVISWW